MPVTAVTNDVFQVRVRGKIEEQETNNIFYFSSATGDTDVELHLILVLANCFITHLVPVLSNKWSLTDLVWKRIFPTLSNEYITVPTGDKVGDITTDSLPSFCSALISKRTDLGGRSHRGRLYLAGAPESATIGSNFDTSGAFWTAVVAFAACLASNFIVGDPPGANSWQGQLYSPKLSGTHFPLPNTTGLTPIKTYTPVAAVATTRSRKVGRGA